MTGQLYHRQFVVVFKMFQSTTLRLKSTGRPKRLRKLPPMRIERHINQEEWHEETSRFGNILRGPQGVLIPENVFCEIEQDMNRLFTSENKIKFIILQYAAFSSKKYMFYSLQICQIFQQRLHVVA